MLSNLLSQQIQYYQRFVEVSYSNGEKSASMIISNCVVHCLIVFPSLTPRILTSKMGKYISNNNLTEEVHLEFNLLRNCTLNVGVSALVHIHLLMIRYHMISYPD